MKRLIPFLFSFILIAPVYGKSKGKVVDYIMETVNGIPILYSDVKKYQAENKVDEKAALEELTQKALLLSEAKRKGITVPEAAVKAALENLAKANGYKSVREFKKAVEKTGISFENLKKKITEQLTIQRLIDIKIKSKLSVSPAEIDRLCNEVSKTIREVYYVKTENSTLANEIINLLKEGYSFENATNVCADKNGCEKGFLGNVEKGTLLKRIDEAVWQAKIKTPITVNIDNTIYLLYVAGEKNENCDRKKIEQKLLAQKYREALKKYLENLRKKAIIEKFNF